MKKFIGTVALLMLLSGCSNNSAEEAVGELTKGCKAGAMSVSIHINNLGLRSGSFVCRDFKEMER